MNGDAIEQAKALLKADGFVVLRQKSYRQAQERQRVAEVRMACAEREMESTTRWAHKAFDEQARLAERCGFLYGQAMARGATADELRGDS